MNHTNGQPTNNGQPTRGGNITPTKMADSHAQRRHPPSLEYLVYTGSQKGASETMWLTIFGKTTSLGNAVQEGHVLVE